MPVLTWRASSLRVMDNFKRLQSRLTTIVDERRHLVMALSEEMQENRLQEFQANTIKGEIHRDKKLKDKLLMWVTFVCVVYGTG